MRLKLIAIFSVVVVVVCATFYGIVRASLGDEADPMLASRALTAAAAQLRVEGLATERWTASRANDPQVAAPFTLATPQARSSAATEACNRVREMAAASSDLSGTQPALVALTDATGVVLGRNGSALMRGDDLGKVYPALRLALEAGDAGSDVWIDRGRNEQLFASYAPVRGEDGKVVGALVVATLLNDERLSGASDRTSGQPLLLAVKLGAQVEIVAQSRQASGLAATFAAGAGADGIASSIEKGQQVDLVGAPAGHLASARPLDGYGDGRRAAIVVVVGPGPTPSLLGPAFGVLALGLLLVVIFASLLEPYFSRPIQELEDGLLAIMNGKTDLRFELEHAELGGLAFRLNSLLNELLGVQEDTTDEQGRQVGFGAPSEPAPQGDDVPVGQSTADPVDPPAVPHAEPHAEPRAEPPAPDDPERSDPA